MVELKEKPNLQPQQLAFVERLISTLPYDPVAAYIAVYGDKGEPIKNSKNASQVLRNPKVQEYKRIREQEILESLGFGAENVARKLIEMGFAEKGDTVYTPQVQLKALDLLQKQLGVQSSKSTIEANVKEQVVIVNDLPEDADGNQTK